MKKSFKTLISVILAVIMILSVMITPMAAKTTKDANGGDVASMFDIQIDTNKNSYGVLGVAKITVKVTNISGNTISNVGAEAVIDQLDPCGRSSDVYAEDSALEPGETMSFTYKATLDSDAVGLNGWNSFWLKFKRFFQGSCNSEAPDFNDGRAYEIASKEISFGKYDVEQIVKVWYDRVTVSLSTDKDEVLLSSTAEKIYFYAKTTCSDANVVLYNDAGEMVSKMLDDGQYSKSGDDIKGDGIYSSIIYVDCSDEKTFRYYAIVSEQNKSNEVEVKVVAPLTNLELNQMQSVDSTLTQEMSTEEYKKADDNGRAIIIDDVLDDLSSNDNGTSLINADSIIHDENNNAYYFQYSCGIYSGVIYSKRDGKEAGSSYQGEINAGNMFYIQNSYNNLSKMCLGEAVITYGWDRDYSLDNGNYALYPELESYWEEHGLDTSIVTAPTIEQYKTLFLDKELVVIAEHGLRYSYWTGPFSKDTTSLIATQQDVTKEMSKALSLDIKNDRVFPLTLESEDGTVQTLYCMSPEFFSHYYEDKLDNTIVYISSCCGFGENQEIDYDFSFAFRELCGASAVVGFHNSVYIMYTIFMLNVIVDELFSGNNMEAALDVAVEEYGDNDVFFANKYTDWDTSNHNAATVFLSGSNASLVSKQLLNTSFEETPLLTKWRHSGDVRVITQLGELMPTSKNKMVILTTGIGSKESDYLEATEGSVLQQTFIVPSNADVLSFDYNVVSEEPNEYVGSVYDDKFVVELIDKDGNTISTVATETVNTSTWYKIDGIDFADGDSTVYHTQWKKASVDISKYREEMVSIKFVVYDVGDSYYDTAALVDNVQVL